MATIAELKELMLKIGVKEAVVTTVDPGQPLARQGVDSVDCPAFAVAVEEKYGVTMSDSDSLTIKTLNDFMNFINAKL